MQGGYEILALFMRYIFVALGALILLRSLWWMRKDARIYRKEIRSLPDAGLVGELVDMQSGKNYPLPREGVLGRARSCDVRLTDGVTASRHFTFLFVEGKGLAIRPLGQNNVLLDGEMLFSTGYALHGTRLEVGGVELRVRLFAGLHVPRRVLYQQDEDGFEEEGPSPFEEVQDLLPQDMSAWVQEETPAPEYVQPPVVYPQPMQVAPMYAPPMDGYMDVEAQSAPVAYPPEQMQENGQYLPYDTEEAVPVEETSEEDDYVPPFEAPKRRRRSEKYML